MQISACTQDPEGRKYAQEDDELGQLCCIMLYYSFRVASYKLHISASCKIMKESTCPVTISCTQTQSHA